MQLSHDKITSSIFLVSLQAATVIKRVLTRMISLILQGSKNEKPETCCMLYKYLSSVSDIFYEFIHYTYKGWPKRVRLNVVDCLGVKTTRRLISHDSISSSTLLFFNFVIFRSCFFRIGDFIKTESSHVTPTIIDQERQAFGANYS